MGVRGGGEYEQGFLDCLLIVKHYVKARIRDEAVREEVIRVLEEVEVAVTERRVERLRQVLGL